MIYSTSSYTKATILLGPKSWYVKMVIYRPASFVSMQVILTPNFKSGLK